MKEIEVIFEQAPPAVKVRANGETTELPALWLRERSQDPAQLDRQTQQRLFDSHAIDPEIALLALEPVGALQARLAFSDGHSSLYDFSFLHAELDADDAFPAAQGWDSALDQAAMRFSWPDMQIPERFLTALDSYLRYGFVVLTQVPTAPLSILDVAAKFGYLKETNFGRYFEVFSKPDANDLAYTGVHLGPHTDNPYRDPVPGIQLLHCLVNQTSGGLSTLVDSVSVVRELAATDPEGYRLLKDTSVKYRFIDRGTELVSHKPIIKTDAQGRTLGVHYSPRLDGLPLLPLEQLKAFHRARQRLGELFCDPAYQIRFPLLAGELMLFDNSRVLHGRTRFDPSEGPRHLQGCYIDLDGPRERYASVRIQLSTLKEVA
ncbi:TauD/TfdA family dioxygenase [Pseudomonas lalucatii]|uniref:TauD/TfdA family dioxygenase n=1 Tax=Pseudomonas lalucatii TaxID=1424203 RepID=A0ABS5Q3T1_9PSED|nr:TauD/TfdA family dioxygenase [Pseudomonas lalucatii]MBS7663230.1 TauD/TfdA family dioxygenase [Pseudomonas lalucatii]